MTGTRKEGVCVALPSSCPAPPGCATDLKIKEWSRESSKIRSNQNCFSVCSKMPGFQDYSVQFSSVTQSCPTLYDPMNRSVPGLPVHHQLLESTQTHVHYQWCHLTISSSVIPFSSCPQSFPASGSFQMSQFFASGHQSTGLSASSPSNEHSGLISFRMEWLDLLAVQGTLKRLLQHHCSKASILLHSPLFRVQLSDPYVTTGKIILWLHGPLLAK